MWIKWVLKQTGTLMFSLGCEVSFLKKKEE